MLAIRLPELAIIGSSPTSRIGSFGFSWFESETGGKSIGERTHAYLISMPTGQWSEPRTSGRMNAFLSRGRRALLTRK